MGSTLVDSVDGVVGVGSVLGCGRDASDHIMDSPSASPEPCDHYGQWTVNRSKEVTFNMKHRRAGVQAYSCLFPCCSNRGGQEF